MKGILLFSALVVFTAGWDCGGGGGGGGGNPPPPPPPDFATGPSPDFATTPCSCPAPTCESDGSVSHNYVCNNGVCVPQDNVCTANMCDAATGLCVGGAS